MGKRFKLPGDVKSTVARLNHAVFKQNEVHPSQSPSRKKPEQQLDGGLIISVPQAPLRYRTREGLAALSWFGGPTPLSPEEVAILQERHEKLLKAVGQLPALHRDVVLASLEDAPTSDIAQELQLNEEMVVQVQKEAFPQVETTMRRLCGIPLIN